MSESDFVGENCSSSSGSQKPLPNPVLDEKFLLEESILIIKSFNRLFADIAPISNNFIGKNTNKNVELSQKLLNDAQRQEVMELSGHILTMTSVLFERKLYTYHINDQLALDAIPAKFHDIEKSINTVTSLQKQAYLLKDFLLREVKCNAELEDKIRNLEEEIVELHANGTSNKKIAKKRRTQSQEMQEEEDDKESKDNEVEENVSSTLPLKLEHIPSVKYERAETSPKINEDEEVIVLSTKPATPKRENKKKRKSEIRSGSKNPKKPKAKSTKLEFPDQPTKFVGQFIRKMFGDSYYFGLIANYDEEFCWSIVYEDADSEDMVWEEIIPTYWTSLVPKEKKERCFRHARNLGVLHDSLSVDGMNTNFLQGPAPSLKNETSKSLNEETNEDLEVKTERFLGMDIVGDDFGEVEHSSSSSSIPLIDLSA